MIEHHTVFDRYRETIPKTMREHRIPGLSIAVVDREGTLWIAGFGVTSRAGHEVTPNTMFSIQSMSKSFTATAVVMAVQSGLLDLDRPITAYLPDFSVNSRFEERPLERVTLRHLLTHTAGLAHEAPIGNNFDVRYESFEEHVSSIQQTWLKSPVGMRFGYSNLGIDLAAYVLQTVSGVSFESYLTRHVLDVLGMRDSSMDYQCVRERHDRALGHTQFFRRLPVEIPMVGAGGVYTTAADLARFVRFHLNRGRLDGKQVVRQELIDAMWTSPQISPGYGLGLAICRAHGSYAVSHTGGGFGFLTAMKWYPEYGVGCLVLTNSTNHKDQNERILDGILDALISEGICARLAPGAVPCADDLIGKDRCIKGCPPTEAHTPTPYRKEWKGFERTYRIRLGGHRLRLVNRLALALGGCHAVQWLRVRESDGFLCVNGERLYEHERGLFFTPSGECLDFRSDVPRWRNIALDTPLVAWRL